MRLGSVISRMYLILDNLKMQKGLLVRACLRDHSGFVCHLTPVHSSWMNQLELWLSILQRKRDVSATSLDLNHVAERVMVTVL
jgi:DDE superfamily endonuclease